MAFFGLSALGPQNCFVAARPETYNCTLFEMEEFEIAFDRSDKTKSGSLTLDQVQKALEMVFHGPLPEFEAKRVMDAFQSLGTPSVSRADYVSTLEHVRRTAPGASEDVPLDTTHTAHYNSYDMMKAARLRQRRPSQAPQEMFAKPLTQLQEIGWRSDETPVGYERHPKKACEETKFMGVLWKNGYM